MLCLKQKERLLEFSPIDFASIIEFFINIYIYISVESMRIQFFTCFYLIQVKLPHKIKRINFIKVH